MTKPLSPTMTDMLEEIAAHGGIVERRPGGYWTWPGCASSGGVPITYWGTTTVQALVDRGRLSYSKHQQSRQGEFPVEAKIQESAS